MLGKQLFVSGGEQQLPYKVVKWTGDGALNRTITGVGFRAGAVWFLGNGTQVYNQWESVQNSILDYLAKTANNNGYFYTSYPYDQIYLNPPTEGLNIFNKAGIEYAAICWNSSWTPHYNSTETYNTHIDSNPEVGFQITYHSNQNAIPDGPAYTMPNEVGITPKFIIARATSSSGGGNTAWAVHHSDAFISSPFDGNLFLNSTNGIVTATDSYFEATSPTAFTLGSKLNRYYTAIVTHAWAEIDGITKISSYTGNGGSKTVTTGFKVGLLILKREDGVGNWLIFNDVTEPSNPKTSPTYLNGGTVSGTYSVTFNDTGFVLNNSNSDYNSNGSNYIYMAMVTAEE